MISILNFTYKTKVPPGIAGREMRNLLEHYTLFKLNAITFFREKLCTSEYYNPLSEENLLQKREEGK